ncbi:nitroreductase family protein [Desulfitobacterium chlororespirans]|uniref:Nitroreductase n=1 Tax=Desulfitobacterium chlororespirans DSM 11544 TaxID=1121395 RepID=A0A1M7T0Z1_9FIRM|nr:nitroreductase family protein [Desulfitobacterium chlororespirans]SHN64406.1 Nitroreductase [Desulfitobacterium chlororespirans DSM 11544]
MDMKELLQKRRSIRKYADTPIEKEKVAQLIRAALLSPTSRNTRAWEFILVEDQEVLAKLSLAKVGAQPLKGAALGIVVCADPQKSDVWVEDTSIATIILQLQAQDLGLGSCWVQIRKRNYQDGTPAGEYVKKLLDIPGHLQVESIVALGYPAETRQEPAEDELRREKIHWHTYKG